MANGRWVPPRGFEPPDSHGPWLGLCGGQPACTLVGPEDAVELDPHSIDSWFDRIAARHSGFDVGGEWISRPWDLVARNGAYIERDFFERRQNGVTNRQLATLALVGPSNLLRARKLIIVTNDAHCVTLSVWAEQKNLSRNTACCFRT